MQNMKFKIQGGVYPGGYRSTLITVDCETTEEGYLKAEIWANKNFPDHTHICQITEGRPLQVANVSLPVPVFVAGKKTMLMLF